MHQTGDSNVDFRGNLEVDVTEDVPEVETPGGPTITPYCDKALLDITSGGQETEVEYNRDGYLGADSGSSDEVSVEQNTAVVPIG